MDEVTSGLDEQRDWEIMKLIREGADAGMTVVGVTHTLTNVQEFCHKVVVMCAPGVLAFYGTPDEALAYFEIDRLSDVYKKLGDYEGKAWRDRYRKSEFYERYVGKHLGEFQAPEQVAPTISDVHSDLRRRLPTIVHQSRVLTGRYVKLLLRDRRTLGMAGGQSLLVGLVLSLVFAGAGGDPVLEPALVFLLGLSCLWFGCSNASKEIVKERAIYRQERDVNLSVTSYLASKLIGLALLGFAQVVVLFALMSSLCTVPGPTGLQLPLMLLTILTGTALGLLISASTSSADQATTLVPIVLIPQIVLAGMIVPDMPWLAELLGKLLVSGYWTYEGMSAVLAEGGFSSWALAALLLATHFVVFLVAALWVLEQRDRRGDSVYGVAVRAWVRAAGRNLAQSGARRV